MIERNGSEIKNTIHTLALQIVQTLAWQALCKRIGLL